MLYSLYPCIGHVTAVCRCGCYQLRKLCPLVQSVMVEAARTAAAVFISCRLDYCNSLLYGLLDTLLHKLQSVQNASARLITGTRCSDYVSLLLSSHSAKSECLSSYVNIFVKSDMNNITTQPLFKGHHR